MHNDTLLVGHHVFAHDGSSWVFVQELMASDDASFMTGSDLLIDGGYTVP